MAFVGALITTVKAKTAQFRKGMKKASKATKVLRQDLKELSISGLKFGLVIASAAAAVGIATVKLASDFNEAQQKFDVVFDAVRAKALIMRENLVRDFGLSRTAATELLSATGDLLTGFGFTDAAALGLSNRVQKLSVDLASFSNLQGGAARASEIITKALLGERDSLVALGVKILEADLQQRLLIKGHEKLTGVALRAAKAEATFELILEQTTKAQGDFARSSGSVANMTKTLIARTNDYATSLGLKLLPFVKVGEERLLGMSDAMDDYLKVNDKLIDQNIDKLFVDITVGVGKLIDLLQLAKAAWNVFSAAARGAITVIFTPLASLEQGLRVVLNLLDDDISTESWLFSVGEELVSLAKDDLAEAQTAFEKFQNSLNEGIASKFAQDFVKATKEAGKEISKANEDLVKQQIAAKKVVEEMQKQLQIQKEQEKIRKQIEADKAKVISEAQRIFDETRTPLEKVEAEIKRIMELFQKGGFEGIEEAFDRKIKELEEQRKKLQESIKKDVGEDVIEDIADKFGFSIRDALEEAATGGEEKKGIKAGFKEIDVKNINVSGLKKFNNVDEKQLKEAKKGNELLGEISQKIGDFGGAVAV